MPHQPYYVDGVRVPSVTTILGRWKDSGGLIYWAWKQGTAGLDFRETRDKAADAGTLCHAMVDSNIRGTPLESDPKIDPEVRAQAQHAYRAYQEWRSGTKLEIVESELPLVSVKHRFGGCQDAILVNGKLRLGDWKTSGGVYVEMLIQVAGGYSLLWEENFPERPLEGVEILRFSKPEQKGDPVAFAHYFWDKEIFPLAQKQFLLLREAYDLDQRLKSLL
jgi:hypothetical protein